MTSSPDDAAINGEKGDEDRDTRGRFVKGHGIPGPGNPALRRTREMREAIARACTPERLEAVLGTMIRKAVQEGDCTAAKLVMEYGAGRPRKQEPGDTITLDMPAVTNSEDLAQASAKLLEAVASGQVDLAAAKGISELFATTGRLFELHNLEKRVRLLEGGDGAEPDLRYI